MGDLEARRLAVVREHMDAENRKDFAATRATMAAHPRYELIGSDEVFDGEAALREHFVDTHTGFPDRRNGITALHSSHDTVIVEFVLEGTHLGVLRGLPPTGRAFSCQTIAVFLFEPGADLISCERVYFDSATILRQLGLASDPRSLRGRIETAVTHPLTVAAAFVRRVIPRRRAS